MKIFFGIPLIIGALILNNALASDHDDGEMDLKGRSLNLTDVYAFREDKEVAGGSANHLVFIINTNPRSLPQQQYYFSTQARYELKIGRVGTSVDVPAKTTENIILRAEFGNPDSQGRQPVKLTTLVDGKAKAFTKDDNGTTIYTTPLSQAASPIVSNLTTANGHTIGVFAGLRKDPFFFDVTAFFRFRSAAAGTSGALPVPGFGSFPTYTPDGASVSDFTSEYNVNTIALRVPIAFLQTSGQTVFDTWATISVPQ